MLKRTTRRLTIIGIASLSACALLAVVAFENPPAAASPDTPAPAAAKGPTPAESAPSAKPIPAGPTDDSRDPPREESAPDG